MWLVDIQHIFVLLPSFLSFGCFVLLSLSSKTSFCFSSVVHIWLFSIFLFSIQLKNENIERFQCFSSSSRLDRTIGNAKGKQTKKKDSMTCSISSFLSAHSRCLNMYLYDRIGHRAILNHLISFVMLVLRTRMIQSVWMKAKISIR